MKKFRNLFSEQHREKGRFRPTVPYNVPETKPAAGTLTKKKECTCEETELEEMAGANMDTRAVHSHLKKQGWQLTRTSGGHDVFTHPKSKEHIPVPRHRKLKAPLVLGILRKSKVTEETEMKKLDEISMELHKRYQKAARQDVPALASHAQSGEYKDIAQKILDKRIKGMTRSSALQLRNKMAKEEFELDEEKSPYIAVHAKKGKHETHGSTSYEAAQNAAKHWKMKNTAGISVYRADKTHSTQHVGEETEPPFTPTKPKKDVVVGKKGEGYAKARQLARMAMKKQTDNLSKVTIKQESLDESRKTEVVRELAKKKKEKFEADPVLSDTVVKSAMPQP